MGGGGKLHVQPKTPPRPQTRVRAPAKESALLAAMVVLTTSNGCPNVVTSKRSGGVLVWGWSDAALELSTYSSQPQAADC